MANSIEIESVTKSFRRSTEPGKTLKDRLFSMRRASVETFDALSEIHLEVPVGQTIGILGHNGSGKSTLLKCIAGTLTPDSGEVRVRGSLSALLELGAGFHPDLTGRENVYLNGSILGFSTAKIDQIFDDIVEFSEIPEFVDTQVKHYSSGMFARLGFAVAINLEPDILLIDEVLAVGDEAFQRKCLERVRQLQIDGRTVVIVTHSPETVRQFCGSALVLDHGKAIFHGATHQAAAIYRNSLISSAGLAEGTYAASEPSVASIEDVKINGTDEAVTIGTGDGLIVDMEVHTLVKGLRVRPYLSVVSHDGVLVYSGSSWDMSGVDIELDEGSSVIRFALPAVPLLDGQYEITVILTDHSQTKEFDRRAASHDVTIVSGTSLAGRVKLGVSVSKQGVGTP